MAMWQTVVQALICQTLPGPQLICGAVLSFRMSQDHLAVWNKDASNEAHIAALRLRLQELLEIETIDYLVHQWSLAQCKRVASQVEKQTTSAPRYREKAKDKLGQRVESKASSTAGATLRSPAL